MSAKIELNHRIHVLTRKEELDCRAGRMMAAHGLAHEVEFACRFDAFPIVPVMDNGRLRCA